jgi:hypothetical protein
LADKIKEKNFLCQVKKKKKVDGSILYTREKNRSEQLVRRRILQRRCFTKEKKTTRKIKEGRKELNTLGSIGPS